MIKGVCIFGLFLGVLFLSLSCTEGKKKEEDKPPRAPTCQSANVEYNDSGQKIRISWTESDNANGFVIQRSYQDQTNYSGIGNAGGTEYVDNISIELGTTYWYRVAAYDENGTSDYCEPVSATTKPQPPMYLAASPISLTEIKITWTDAWPGDSDGFKIERSIHDQLSYQQVGQTGKGITEFDDQGLEPGTLYWYRIRAFNAGGDSDYSEPASSTTIFPAYEMCVSKTPGFPCLSNALCSKNVDGAAYLDASASEVFTCLNIPLTVPAHITIFFKYRGRASSCYNKPYLAVYADGGVPQYVFDCNSDGEDSISFDLGAGQTLANMKFQIFSGDWGSSVMIVNITLTPIP